MDIIGPSELTGFLEVSSQKTVCFSEQIMSVDKFPSSIFPHQMEAIVYLFSWFYHYKLNLPSNVQSSIAAKNFELPNVRN